MRIFWKAGIFMYNKKEFEELAADTKKKMLSFGASSRTSVEHFDRCVMLLGEYLSDLDLPFSLENGKLWLDSIEHSSSKVHDSRSEEHTSELQSH